MGVNRRAVRTGEDEAGVLVARPNRHPLGGLAGLVVPKNSHRHGVAGDLVQPVGLLADLQRLCRQRQPDPSHAAALHRRCGCVERSTWGQRKQTGDIISVMTLRSIMPKPRINEATAGSPSRFEIYRGSLNSELSSSVLPSVHSDSEPESDDAHYAELAEIAVVGSHLLGIQRRL